MERRENYTPMEFEYDNTHGHITSPSPFFTHAMARSRSGFSDRAPGRAPSSFSSQTPSKPSRNPSSESQTQALFTKIPSFKTPQQSRQDAFQYTRENIDLDFSSGAENMSSPGGIADNEDTPEQPMRTLSPSKLNDNVTVFRGNKASPTKEKFSGNIFTKSTNAGRGSMLQKKRDDALARRVHKRKRVESNNSLTSYLANRRPSDGSGSEGPSRPTSSEGPASTMPSPSGVGTIGAFFTYLERHPRLPHVLSFYLQLFCNVFIVLAAAYIAYSFWATIRQDVDIQSEHAAAEILVEMAACARDYQDNGCKANRVPAMERMCNSWEKCMNRDPKKVGRARMSAHTFAEIFNSFVEPISYKAMIFSSALIFGSVAISNFAFSYFRSNVQPHPPSTSQTSYFQPQAPSHFMQSPFHMHPQGQHMGFPTQEQHYMPFAPPSPDKKRVGLGDGGRHSPTKMLGYR